MEESTTRSFRVEKSDIRGYFEVCWPPFQFSTSPASLWSLKILVHHNSRSPIALSAHEGPQSISLDRESPITKVLLSMGQLHTTTSATAPVEIRILFSSDSGYVIRSDTLQYRLECCPGLLQVFSFLDPLQKVKGIEIPGCTFEFPSLLPYAVGALVLKEGAVARDFDVELQNRLSLPFLQAEPIPSRRIAWVQGREDIDCIERALKAAAALGIKLVILDEPGHWLQDPKSPWANLREAFVPLDISPDSGLATRVANAVKSYPEKIDGIVTISDVRLPAIAEACRILGLPTESAEAYEIAGDKGRTRLLEPVGADESFVLPHAGDLGPYLEQREQPLRFPLVVKPVVGWSSDCVSKVKDVTELEFAVRKASDRHAHAPKQSTVVVVEPYVDGPEVDANFVLLDGEILFLDINDDFPSPADQVGAGLKANFQETQNVIPSGLPKAEQDAIRNQLRDSIIRQGFRSGVFHCEARGRNSTVSYGPTNNGFVDLVAKPQTVEIEELSVYLHEINARPPGYLESVAVLLAYGVDYYALRMLLALGPQNIPRLRALSQPFLRGPQFHLSLMIIQQTRAGIMKTGDAAKEFLEKHPHMKEHVVDYYTRKKGGDVLGGPDASSLWWIAYFSVVSRKSRQELLERVEYIQRHFDYEVEEL